MLARMRARQFQCFLVRITGKVAHKRASDSRTQSLHVSVQERQESLCGSAHRQMNSALLRERRSLVEQTVTSNRERRSVILVVEDVEETRHGIERLLTTSGYQVSSARDEEEAVLRVGLHRPDLILICLGLDVAKVLPVARRIRERTGLGEEVPVVGFCVTSLSEGAEVAVGHNVYMMHPDNFDQLRALLSRLLRTLPRAGAG
jgi:CheY-like chemotaxis protein